MDNQDDLIFLLAECVSELGISKKSNKKFKELQKLVKKMRQDEAEKYYPQEDVK